MDLILSVTAICLVTLIIMQGSSVSMSKCDALTGRSRYYSVLLIGLFGFTLAFAAAFREGFQDTGVYKGLYKQIGTEYSNAFREDFVIQDTGFNLFMVFLNRIHADPQLLIIVTSAITFSGYMIAVAKYGRDIPFSLLLLLCLDYITALNGIRQVMAGALLIVALPWLRDRKIIPYMLLVLLASTLHGSAVVLIPLYFVLSGKRLNTGVWLFFLGVGMCFAMPSVADRILGSLLEDSTYSEYLEIDDKMGLLRFLVVLVPTLLTMIYCKIQHVDTTLMNPHAPDYKKHRMIDVLVNMQMVYMGFSALGMKMVYFARINLFFPCVLALLLPEAIEGTFTKDSAQLVKKIAITCYLLFYAYQIYTYKQVDGFGGFKLIF